MTATLTAAGLEQLAELAAAETRRHAPRTPERRAAAALWTALVTTKTVDAARSALAGFAAPEVQADALELLLHRLAAHHAGDDPARCGNDGATSPQQAGHDQMGEHA